MITKVNGFTSFKNTNTPYNHSEKQNDKSGFLDKFETSIVNSADLNDTIKVPRTIFKGYLAFMVGTALGSLAGVSRNKFKGLSTALNLLSIATVTYGTWSFVKPYVIKTTQEK